MTQKYTAFQKLALGVAAVCAAAVVGMVVAFGGMEKKGAPVADKGCTDAAMAYIMSRRFVERSLAAPSTAKFPSFHDEGVHAAQAGECRFQVEAFVDAQNNFGAMVRTRYTIDMEYLPDSKSWRGTSLQM